MRANVKSGYHLLFMEGAAGKNYLDIEDELIVNILYKHIFTGHSFRKKDNQLVINTTKGIIKINFSSEVLKCELTDYDRKDQLIFKIIKP